MKFTWRLFYGVVTNLIIKSTAINFTKKVYKNKNSTGFVSAGYYETILSKGVLHDDLETNWDMKTKEKYDMEAIDIHAYDFFILEPVRDTFDLEPTNIKRLFKKLAKNKKYPKIVIIDSSFIGNTLDIKGLIELVKNSNLIIFNIRSGIKHDQFGMEFCNVGYLDAYFLNEAKRLASYTYKHLINSRDFIGGNLSFRDYCLIDNNVTFSSQDTHAEKVLESTNLFNEQLREEIDMSYSVDKVIYPYETRKDELYKTPVIYLSLSENSEELYKAYCDIIEYVVDYLELKIFSRNSFGFRYINFEYFNLSDTNEYLLKIAPGVLRGVSFYSLIFILKKLSEKSPDDIIKMERNIRCMV